MAGVHQVALRAGFTALLAGCAATSPQPPSTWDGLEYRPARDGGALYVRAGAESRAWRTVVIDPLAIAIPDDWLPVGNTGESTGVIQRRLSNTEIQHIKDNLAGAFHRIFAAELEAGGYRVLEQPGGDTVRVSPGLADVYLDTPDGSLTQGQRADRMTLVLELRDAPTGQLFVRYVDQEAGAFGVLQFPNSVTNNAEFRHTVQAWAQELRACLDRMNAQGA